MSWWKSFIVQTALAFFESLLTAEPAAKAVAKPIALKTYKAIKLAFGNDPDFQ